MTSNKSLEEKVFDLEKRILAMEAHLRARYEYSRRNAMSVLNSAKTLTSAKAIEEYVEGKDSTVETVPRDETFYRVKDLVIKRFSKWGITESDAFYLELREIFYGPEERRGELTGDSPGKERVIDISAEDVS